jgi:hypothetical protein
VTGNHDDRRIDAALAQPRQGRESVHAGQPNIQHDDVVRGAHDAVEAGFAALDGVDGVPLVAEHAAQRAAHPRFVVNDQNGGLHEFADVLIF